MNALHTYRSIVASRLVAAFAAALLAVGTAALPDALIAANSAGAAATAHSRAG